MPARRPACVKRAVSVVGLSLAVIARVEGIYPNAVRHRLRAAGVPLRAVGHSRP